MFLVWNRLSSFWGLKDDQLLDWPVSVQCMLFMSVVQVIKSRSNEQLFWCDAKNANNPRKLGTCCNAVPKRKKFVEIWSYSRSDIQIHSIDPNSSWLPARIFTHIGLFVWPNVTIDSCEGQFISIVGEQSVGPVEERNSFAWGIFWC